MNPQTRNSLIVLAILALIGLGVGGYFAIDYTIKSRRAAPFNARMAEFTAVAGAPAPAAPPVTGRARPKMITVDMDKQQVDWVFFDLPKELQAGNPDEVETVVALRWGEERVLEYEGGGFGIRHLCTVSVYDKASRQLVAQTQVQGGDPPQRTETSAGSNDYGSKPTKEIVSFLRSVSGR